MMDVKHSSEGWHIVSTEILTNKEARTLEFRADPEQVVMGDYVKISDPGGMRTGHVSTASYHERWDGPAYVVVSIELR